MVARDGFVQHYTPLYIPLNDLVLYPRLSGLRKERQFAWLYGPATTRTCYLSPSEGLRLRMWPEMVISIWVIWPFREIFPRLKQTAYNVSNYAESPFSQSEDLISLAYVADTEL
jgi:hypothetical protein